MYREHTCVYCHNPINTEDYKWGFQELFEGVWIEFHTFCFGVAEGLVVI